MHSSSLFSFSSRHPIITCRVSPPSSPPFVASVPLPPSSSSDSLACSLQCPHFQSYASLRQINLHLLVSVIIDSISSLDFPRCSGCTQEFNLHRPAVVDEASGFFKRYGVEDFTFDSCRLVLISHFFFF